VAISFLATIQKGQLRTCNVGLLGKKKVLLQYADHILPMLPFRIFHIEQLNTLFFTAE
jgi:hypothetical protein